MSSPVVALGVYPTLVHHHIVAAVHVVKKVSIEDTVLVFSAFEQLDLFLFGET